MHILAKAGIATLGAGAIGGVGFAGYSHFSKTNFKDNLGKSVLSLTGSENETQWKARLDELSKNNTNLPKDLSNLKTGKQWNDLQKWCLGNSTNTFSNEEDSNYSNFETFCTWKIGDKDWEKKITADKGEAEAAWGTAHTNLKDKKGLSEELKKVKNTAAESDNKDKKAMHGWCTANYKKTWKDDATSKEVETYCRS